MLYEKSQTSRAVRGMVHMVSRDAAMHDDLMQEACIHLWLRETERPGQSSYWYLQSCRFHLQNLLRKGRSVDSCKHRQSLCLACELEEAGETAANWLAQEPSILSVVCARDLMEALTQWLTPREKETLALLADGLSLREIAQRLQLSHTSIVKHRRRIAEVARQLGVIPPAKVNGTRSRKVDI